MYIYSRYSGSAAVVKGRQRSLIASTHPIPCALRGAACLGALCAGLSLAVRDDARGQMDAQVHGGYRRCMPPTGGSRENGVTTLIRCSC